jgi:uncharacterized protein (TIGR03000 family)
MYSVVLLAALTASGQAPDCHRGGGCYSSCSGCSGRSWVGCHGGCYGTCYGGCYGNYGIDAGYGCYGSCAGNYFGYSGTGWGGSGCGGCYGSFGYADYSSSGCNGCMGSYGVSSPYFPTTPQGTVVPSNPVRPPDAKTQPTEPLPLPNKKPGAESLAPSKAKLIVEVPAGAKLFIDDRSMNTPSEHRVYQTPTLEQGQTYYYEVRVEFNHDGKALSQTKRVLLRAGQEVRADFKDMETTATAKAE